jgi:hypothetical protein
MNIPDDEQFIQELERIVCHHILFRMTIALALPPISRKGENLLSLLSLDIVLHIVRLSLEPPMFDQPFSDLCYEIIYDYHRYNLNYELEGFTFSVKMQEELVVSIGSGGPDDMESDDGGPDDEGSDDEDDIHTICVYMRHASLGGFLVHPEETVLDRYGRNEIGIRLRDPRQQPEAFIEDIEYTTGEEESKACYVTRSYRFPDEEPAIRNVLDLVLSIVLQAAAEQAADDEATDEALAALLTNQAAEADGA